MAIFILIFEISISNSRKIPWVIKYVEFSLTPLLHPNDPQNSPIFSINQRVVDNIRS